MPEHVITWPAQQTTYLCGRVVMVDRQPPGRAGRTLADGTTATLCGVQPVIIVRLNPVHLRHAGPVSLCGGVFLHG